jgi:hypothetical protein
MLMEEQKLIDLSEEFKRLIVYIENEIIKCEAKNEDTTFSSGQLSAIKIGLDSVETMVKRNW